MKVSIIIATFNGGKTLSRALDSVKTQSFQNWECIVVDGASNDDTIDIIKEYQLADNRFRFISEPDNGIYDAFNKGWKLAKGEWIYYLGADDMLEKDGLNNLLKEPNDVDAIYGDVMCVYSKSKQEYCISPETEKIKKQMMSHQSMIMRRSLIQSVGGFDTQYKICADIDIVQKAIKAGATFMYKNVLVAFFYVGGISSTGMKNLKEAYLIRKKYGYENSLKLRFRFFVKYLKRTIRLLLRKVRLVLL